MSRYENKIVRRGQSGAEFLLEFYIKGDFPNDTMNVYVQENLEVLCLRATSQNLHHNPTTCWKLSYETQQEALNALAAIQNLRTCGKKPTRVYCCDECRQWHLTSMTVKRYRDLQKRA